jgi:hypothetical protein
VATVPWTVADTLPSGGAVVSVVSLVVRVLLGSGDVAEELGAALGSESLQPLSMPATAPAASPPPTRRNRRRCIIGLLPSGRGERTLLSKAL